MSTKSSIAFLLILAILAACTPSPATELSAVAETVLGPVVPSGQPEVRDLSPITELVSNCGSGSGIIVKHPSMSVVTNYAVEWEVGGTFGIGVTIGEGVIPGGVNLESALHGLYATQFDQGVQQSTAWDLPAEPNYIVEYTIMWREIWQPAYIDVTLADQSVKRIDLRYRTGIQSDIIGQRSQTCGGEPATPQTAVSTTDDESLTGDLLPNGEVVSPESLSRLIGGDAAYWTKRGPVVWGYWNEGHNETFRHPGNDTILTYWAGFAEPRNAEGCSITIPASDNLTRYVKCPPGTTAEFEADGVGFHLIDYTGFFP